MPLVSFLLLHIDADLCIELEADELAAAIVVGL